MLVIAWTAANEEEAARLIRGLVEQRLVACGSILGNIRSIYVWEGRMEDTSEVQCLLKTVPGNEVAILAYIQQHGSYRNPEFLCLPSEWVSPDYQSWAAAHIKGWSSSNHREES